MNCAEYLVLLRVVLPDHCNNDTESIIEDVLEQLAGRSEDEIIERLCVILTDDFSIDMQDKMDYLKILSEIFPNHAEAVISSVIDDANAELPDASDEEKMERMCVLLTGDFSNQHPTQGKLIEDGIQNADTMSLEDKIKLRYPDVCPNYVHRIINVHNLDYWKIVKTFDMNGYKKANFNVQWNEDADILQEVLKLFPNACEEYVKKLIRSGLDLERIIGQFSSGNYIKSQNRSTKQVDKVHKRLCEMLPNFDPDFLKEQALNLKEIDDSAISKSVDNLMSLTEYPTIVQYKQRQEQKASMISSYLFDFKLDDFLDEVGYKLDAFENNNKHSLVGEESLQLEQDKNFALHILKLVYSRYSATEIETTLIDHNYNIVQCAEKLGEVQNRNLNKDAVSLPENSFKNKQLFQELAYIIFKPHLIRYNSLRSSSYDIAYQEAKVTNSLLTCKCCFDDNLVFLPNECFVCRNSCVFCKECMKKGCEVAYSNGNLEIMCFANCGAEFSDGTLYSVMNPVAFYKLMQRKQYKEIREANVDGLESCPFCDFTTVVERENKLFECPECGKESCRECRHEAHVPLRCTEIEYDEDVKMRTFIEDKMSDALMRTCKKCAKRIIKDSGCNLMTCDCGTTMCYVCGDSGITYGHFGARCPQMSDQEALHRANVLDGAKYAKEELGVDKDPKKLKFDPTKNF